VKFLVISRNYVYLLTVITLNCVLVSVWDQCQSTGSSLEAIFDDPHVLLTLLQTVKDKHREYYPVISLDILHTLDQN